MSKVAIKGNASGTGTFTVEAPNSNTDRTLVLPDEAGTVVTTGGTGSVTADMLNSTLDLSGKTVTLPAAQELGSAKAWAYYTQVGTTAIISSHNISGIVDNGTGVATLSFITNPGPDGDYIVVTGSEGQNSASVNYSLGIDTRATGSVKLRQQNSNGAEGDYDDFNVVIFGT